MLRLSSTIAAPPRARESAPPPPLPEQTPDGPRTQRYAPARLAPVGAAVLMAVVWLAIKPHTVDMAAHVFRARLFGEEGFTIWDGFWYGGHHTPAYSVIFPPFGWLLTPWVAGALSTVAAAALFEPFAHRQWGRRGLWAALWFGAGTGALLFTGRLPFALGTALGIAALLAHQRGRMRWATAAAITSGLASPVSALFLAMAAVAAALGEWTRARGADRALGEWTRARGADRALGERTRARGADRARAGWAADAARPASIRWAAIGIAAFVPPAMLAVAFPEGGYMPFDFSTYVTVPLLTLVGLVFLPRREHALRIGLVIYALATTAALCVHTPMGSNAVRLGALFAGPVAVATVRIPKRLPARVLLVVLIAGMGAWQWSSAWRDFAASQNEPSAKVSYYTPLLRFLADQRREDGRVEIPFTRSHWEAAVVAPHFPLARGWERQLDAGRNSLFYSGILTDFTYANWLAEHAVRFVALPDVKPDESSFKERGLIEGDPPYLKLIRRLPHWRIYLFTLPHPMVIPDEGVDMKLTHLGSDELDLVAHTRGSALLRVQWSPYWRVRDGCVERAGDWTRVTVKRPGPVHIWTSFALSRVLQHGPRCG